MKIKDIISSLITTINDIIKIVFSVVSFTVMYSSLAFILFSILVKFKLVNLTFGRNGDQTWEQIHPILSQFPIFWICVVLWIIIILFLINKKK